MRGLQEEVPTTADDDALSASWRANSIKSLNLNINKSFKPIWMYKGEAYS